MTFFLDNNMPYKLAAVLQAMELEVVHLRDHYGRGDVPDEKWMPEIAALGWTALTYDRKIAVKPSERDALKAAGLTIVFVKPAILHWPEKKQVAFFIEHWDEMVAVVRGSRAGGRWYVWQQNGKVKPHPDQ